MQHVSAEGGAHNHICMMCRYVRSIEISLVTVTCSGGLLVVGGTAPESGTACTTYYSTTMLVPLASDAKDRNQRSAWSRPF